MNPVKESKQPKHNSCGLWIAGSIQLLQLNIHASITRETAHLGFEWWQRLSEAERNRWEKLVEFETQVHMCWVSKCWRSGTFYPWSSITAKFWEGCVSQATNISYHWSGCCFSSNELLEIVSAVVPMWAGYICISRELESGVCCGCCDDGMIYMMICIEMLDHELKSFSNWSSLRD